MDVKGKPMGVYSVYLLARTGGSFSKEIKVKCEQEKMVMTHSYADTINANWKTTGRIAEFHEAETIAYYQQGEADLAAKKEAEQIEHEATKVLKEAIKEVKKPRKPRAKKAAPKTDENNDITI